MQRAPVVVRSIVAGDRRSSFRIATASRSNTYLARGAIMLTHLSEYKLPWLAAIAVCSLSGRPARRAAAGRALVSLAGCSITAEVAKRIIRRPRPPATIPELRPLIAAKSPWSMPSSHAAEGAAVVAALAASGESAVALAVASMLIVIDASRVAVGAHYPSDLVVGTALGACFGSACGRRSGIDA